IYLVVHLADSFVERFIIDIGAQRYLQVFLVPWHTSPTLSHKGGGPGGRSAARRREGRPNEGRLDNATHRRTMIPTATPAPVVSGTPARWRGDCTCRRRTLPLPPCRSRTPSHRPRSAQESPRAPGPAPHDRCDLRRSKGDTPRRSTHRSRCKWDSGRGGA